MIVRFFLLSLFIIFIAGCENLNDQTFSLSSMVEEKKPIGSIDIRDDKHIITANEEAKTSKQKKIDEFESIIADIKLKRVKRSKISELNKEYANEDKLFTIAVANKMNRKDVLIIDLTSDGKGLVVSFEDGGSTDEVYEIQNGKPNFFEDIRDFYKSIYKEKTIEPN